MLGRYVALLRNAVSIVGVLALVLVGFAACGGSTTSTTGNAQNQTPIKIGISLSQSGDFAADGKAFQQGYQLWADAINKSGGVLGRKVTLDIVNDASSATQVQTNYQKLITVDKVDLVFGPYSSLLTKPASVIANRYGYAMPEGAGGAPSVFNRGLNNVFDVSPPLANGLLSFANYILSLPATMRPKSIAYATQDDPFTQPQVDNAKAMLEKAGIKTAYYTVYPAETTDFTPIAAKVIASGAQVDVLGTQFPDIVAFVQAFKQQHYNPQAIVATAGPDQGAQFIKAVGLQNTEGIMVPNVWFPQANTYQNADMVKAFLAQYGGKISDISVDVAEGFSVGQVIEQAANKIKSIDNAALIKELHSGDTFNSVQGPVKFDSVGQNIVLQTDLFQWQKGNLVAVYPTNLAEATALYPKPSWP